MEAIARTLQEEVNTRQVEFQQIVPKVKELCGPPHEEVRDREDAGDMILKRVMVETILAHGVGLEQHTDRICSIEEELMVLKQSSPFLRGVALNAPEDYSDPDSGRSPDNRPRDDPDDRLVTVARGDKARHDDSLDDHPCEARGPSPRLCPARPSC